MSRAETGIEPEARAGDPRSPGRSAVSVREFRQILLWPIELMRSRDDARSSGPLDAFLRMTAAPGSPWTELDDEFPDDPRQFQERHYREFVSFQPHVQRLLYGVRRADGGTERTASPLRVFRRRDIAHLRVALGDGRPSVTLEIVHVDLYFYHDVDVAMFAIEVAASDLDLDTAQDLVFKLGRAYPNGWSSDGQPAHCAETVELLDSRGVVLARSDFEDRQKFLAAVCRDRTPAIAAHWQYLLAPLASQRDSGGDTLAVRMIEYYRMPQMVFLAVDALECLTRHDFARIALALAPGRSDAAPFGEAFLDDFEQRYCYDRYHDPRRGSDWVDTRVMCCGHTFALVGDARRALVGDTERGVLARFRHQYFLIGMLAHFHRATLLMLSDRFVRIVNRLDVGKSETVARFRTEVRVTHEVFLRFTHRYWFPEVTDQAVGRDLFRLWTRHLETEQLYAGVREEIQDMSQYLDSDLLRRTSRSMVRLTVVAILSLIGTATTGFFGMNLIEGTVWPLLDKVTAFAIVGVLTATLTLYTVLKARRIAEFLDTLADERVSWGTKAKSFGAIWRRGSGG